MSNCSKRVLHSSKRLCAEPFVYPAWQTPLLCLVVRQAHCAFAKILRVVLEEL
jgi:hypothetical protein